MKAVPSFVELFAAKGFLLILLTLTTGYILNCNGAVVVRLDEETSINERPIIGVLSQEQSFYLHGKYPEENYTSYIAASYVKDIEASGARVVPILLVYYDAIFNS